MLLLCQNQRTYSLPIMSWARRAVMCILHKTKFISLSRLGLGYPNTPAGRHTTTGVYQQNPPELFQSWSHGTIAYDPARVIMIDTHSCDAAGYMAATSRGNVIDSWWACPPSSRYNGQTVGIDLPCLYHQEPWTTPPPHTHTNTEG